jgi:hypothetical protein
LQVVVVALLAKPLPKPSLRHLLLDVVPLSLRLLPRLMPQPLRR